MAGDLAAIFLGQRLCQRNRIAFDDHVEIEAWQAKQQIAQGEATIPVTIGDEKLANPFLRADLPEVAAGIGMAGKEAAEVFAEIRARKNKF